jgi:hypothetical protein
MEVIIKFKNHSGLPEISQIAFAKELWEGGKNFSRFGDDNLINRYSMLSLSWDKWLDNVSIEVDLDSRTYIEIKKDNNKSEFHLSINNDAILVDLRAFIRAILFISKSTEGIILWNKQWITCERFIEENKNLIVMDFNEALKGK